MCREINLCMQVSKIMKHKSEAKNEFAEVETEFEARRDNAHRNGRDAARRRRNAAQLMLKSKKTGAMRS